MVHTKLLKNTVLALLFSAFSVGIYAQNNNSPTISPDTSINNPSFDWYNLQDAQALAKENEKKVLIYANAVWCTYCKKMEKEIFTLDTIQDITNKYFYSVWLDIESDRKLIFRGNEMTEIDFARGMRVSGTPTFIFLDEEGEIIAGQPGFIPEELYSQILEFVGSNAYLDQSFDEFVEQ